MNFNALRGKKKLHVPSEIFGFPLANISEEASKTRQAHRCPFLNKECTKQSRIIDYPLGVCSVWHKLKEQEFSPHIICPNRFYFKDFTLIKELASDFLGSTSFGLLPEIRITSYGSVDWIAFVSDPRGNIVDFCGIELVANDTTQTGELVKALKDFKQKNQLGKNYKFGLNTYNAIKLTLTQIIKKGQVFEGWRKKYIWVLQDELLKKMVAQLNLQLNVQPNNKKIIFTTVKMERNNNIFQIKKDSVYYATIKEISNALITAKALPSIDELAKGIQRRSSEAIWVYNPTF